MMDERLDLIGEILVLVGHGHGHLQREFESQAFFGNRPSTLWQRTGCSVTIGGEPPLISTAFGASSNRRHCRG